MKTVKTKEAKKTTNDANSTTDGSILLQKLQIKDSGILKSPVVFHKEHYAQDGSIDSAVIIVKTTQFKHSPKENWKTNYTLVVKKGHDVSICPIIDKEAIFFVDEAIKDKDIGKYITSSQCTKYELGINSIKHLFMKNHGDGHDFHFASYFLAIVLPIFLIFYGIADWLFTGRLFGISNEEIKKRFGIKKISA